MKSYDTAVKIYNFIEQAKSNNEFRLFPCNIDPQTYFQKTRFNIGLDRWKEIVLQEETGLELGGLNKRTIIEFIPTIKELISDSSNIYLIGPDINEISEKSIDFGMILLINLKKRVQDNEELYEIMRNSFNSIISDGIDGFSIRSIPKRLWCRISKKLLNHNFSFEILGNAIYFLYKSKFKEQINSMEILFISSDADKIKIMSDITSPVSILKRNKWVEKIDEWKKRIDCDYDWGCNQCPYTDTCAEIRDAINIRRDRE